MRPKNYCSICSPAPTKGIPGISSVNEQNITARLTQVDNAIKKGDWATANNQTNTLGIDMTRFQPSGIKGKTLRETANFDAMYTKLQADVKTKNKTAAMKDIQSLQAAMKTVKPTT